MSETAIDGIWRWHDVMYDLESQGGLAGVTIDPLSVNAHGCGGVTQFGTKFYITWVPEHFLLVSMTQREQVLVEAFAAVVGYRPFCMYNSKDTGLLTVEWDKKDPEGRFVELQTKGELSLQRIN